MTPSSGSAIFPGRPSSARAHSGRWARLTVATLLPILVVACSSSGPTAANRSGTAGHPQERLGGGAAASPLFPYGVASGIQWAGPLARAKQLDDLQTIGARWIRFDFTWYLIQPNGPSSYDWTKYEDIVKDAATRGIQVLGTLAYTPSWARPSDCTTSPTCAPANVSDFANFAGATAAHFAPLGVHAWEIWNEPNIGFWKPKPDPAKYTALLKAAYVKIKAADPWATVVTGGTAPSTNDGTNFSPYTFDAGIYRNGGKGYFDAIGHHPYCFKGTFDCPNKYATLSAWSQMQDTPNNLVALMKSYGDGNKKIWATEFGAPTNGGTTAVTEAHQASMITDGYALWKTYPWAGPMFIYTYRDLGTDTTNPENWFGLVHYDYSPKPSYYAYQASALGS